MTHKDDLTEREKELDCLYKIAEILTGVETDINIIILKISELLKNAMTYPKETLIKISFSHLPDNKLEEDSITDNLPLFVYKAQSENGSQLVVNLWCSSVKDIINREKQLIISAISLLLNAISKNSYYKKLEEKTIELESKNSALKEVLYQIGKEKEDYISSTRQEAEMFLFPIIGELEDTAINQRQKGLIKELKIELESIIGSQKNTMLSLSNILTVRELEITAMIRGGKTTKDIAALLNISSQTVERHRNSVRKKLGINKKSVNLVQFLRNM